ncbi:MAG: OmpA family protein, partial [Solirubrobacteraceae bacterium]
AFGRTDFRDDLTKMAVPTLVIHGDCDGTVPFEVSGKRSHEAITGASSSSSRAPRTASTSPTPRSSTPRCWRSSRSRSGADVPGHDGGPGTRFRSQADVLFAFNKATLSRRARSRIAAAVRALRERKPRRVRVVGYTDSKGSEAFNLGLSRRRAAAVARALRAALGGQAPLLVTQGRGEADPVASNTRNGTDDPRGRARNRRVELVYG